MNRRDTSPATSTDKEVRNARIITTFLTVFMAIVTVYFFSQGADTATSLKAYLITMTLGSAVAGWLTYKRRVQWGIPILVSTFWLLLIFNQFTSAGDGLLNGLVAAVATAGIAFPTMSGKRLNRIISFGVAIGVTVVFIDIFGPADRPVYENTSFDYVFIASLTGALVYFLGRQLREANLRPKLIASYAFIAVIGAVFAYGSTQLATQRLSQDAVPSLQAFAHVAQESHTVQAEALEYVSLGEDETIEQLEASAAELATLAAQLPELANDEEEVRDFTALADKANEAGSLAQAVVESHSQTLAAIESMETAEAEMLVSFEQAQAVVDAEIARNIASGDLEELENDSIPSQLFFADFSFNTQLMLAETLEFVTTGEPAAAADFEVTQGQLEATLAELESVLDAEEPGEGDLAAQLAENAAIITAAGRSVIAAHENTLELLDQLEALEAELDINLASVEQLIEQDVSEGESTSGNVVILATVVALVISGGMGVLMSSTVVEPVSRLVVAAQKLGSGDLSAQANVETKDEIGTLASTFNNMAVQLRQTLGQLDRRARQMETSSEVSRRLSTILDENELVTAVVTSLQEAFNYYHVHIYMLDKAENQLVMAGGTGKAGAQLLAQKHAIAIGRGLVGTAAHANVTNLVPDVTANEDWVANPLLPDTRAEIAVPIALGNEVLGVLDVQSNVTQGLGELDQELLQSITSQVAIALQNARQYEEVQRSQKSLQERETLMRTIIDSTPDWIFAKDKNHRYMVVNKEFAATMNMVPAEVVGKDDLEIGIPEMVVNGDPDKGIPGVWPGERKVMDGGEMEILEEETTITTTGRHMFMTTTRVPLKDADGNVTGLVGFIHDITERKEFETELEEAHNRTQEVLESINVPLVISRVADGIVAYVNDPMAELIGVDREKLIGQITPDFYNNPADREAYLKGLREHGYVSNYDLHLKRGDGRLIWTLVSGRVIHFQGEPAIISSLMDISERRAAEALVARRATELATVANVSTVAATILEPDELLQQAVDLTKERFGLYHAHLYLMDENRTRLVLANGAGEIGHKMVTEGRQIALTQEQSLVARAARTRQGVVINDVQMEPGFLPNPLLPETRSELAVPMIASNEVLGVLDVQGAETNRFTSEEVNVFTTLASQIAVAVQNARRHDEAQRALDELTRLQRIMVREGWEDYLAEQERQSFGYAFTTKGAKPIGDETEKPVVVGKTNGSKSTKKPETAVAKQNGSVAIPIAVRGETIGKIGLRTPDGSTIPERKQALIKTVAHQVSEALERVRLTEQTQLALTQAEKRSEEIALVNRLVTQISSSLDLQHSLQIIVDELAVAVNVDQVRIALLEKERNELVVIAEHYDNAKATSAVGMIIPIEGNELTQTVIRTREMVVVEDAQNNLKTMPVHEMFREQGIETVILMPLVVNDEVLGTIGLDILDKRPVPHGNLQLAQTIVYQTATAIQNARLFEQTQAALAETEMLYTHSSQLNTATNLQVVLETATAPGFQAGAQDSMLLVYGEQVSRQPQDALVAAAVPVSLMPSERAINLTDEPWGKLWPIYGKNVVFVGDVAQDDRLTKANVNALKKQDVHALAIMYLTVGSMYIGQIVIRWNKPRTFTNADERLYGAIAQQASSVVYNRLLFNQTEEALSETAALYQASADLNTAQTYDEVLTALRRHTVLGQKSWDVNISFFDEPMDGTRLPKETILLAGVQPLPEGVNPRTRVEDSPLAGILLKLEEPVFFEDVGTDERLPVQARKILSEHYGAKSYLFVPLRLGNQSIGLVGAIYKQNMRFSEEQMRRLNVLVNQAAVSIQSLHLLTQTRRRADREALINNINKKIQSAPTVEFALQTAVAELGQALRLKKALVELSLDEQENGHQQEIPSGSAEPA